MASASFLFLALLSLSVLLSSAAKEEEEEKRKLNQHPSCQLIGCGKQGGLPFPFNESYPDCGFYEAVNCSGKTPQIQLKREGRQYRLKDISQGQGETIVIQDEQLQEDLKHNRCHLIDNLDLLDSPTVYFEPVSTLTKLTLFKCHRNHPNIDLPPMNFTYSRCNDFIIHYDPPQSLNQPYYSTPPPGCRMILYPINTSLGLQNLVTLLTSDITLTVRLSQECWQCRSSGGQCQDNMEGKFGCTHRSERTAGAPTGSQHAYIKNNKKRELAIGFGVSGGIITILTICFLVNRQRHKRNASSDPSSTTGLEVTGAYFGIPIFHYNELEKATNYFDPVKEIGDGGFGAVYHGQLGDGREVAVKRLYRSNYKRVAQFINEVQILTRLRHPNLVSLYGCTSRHSRELLLVYEFVPNGTVADHLHGVREGSGLLTWPIRLSIAIETASALCYLHASDVVHRDVKTNNILLDNSFSVKVADFGISRLVPFDVTHVSTAPQGTPGYVDPEYHQCYQLTEKSDVYSFGVVLIELISSLPAVDITRHRHEINLSNYAINKIQQRAFHELIDPRLGFDSDVGVNRMTTLVAELAFRCLQPDKEMRPSMDEVLEILKAIENEEHEFEKQDRAAKRVGSWMSTLPPPPPPPYCGEVGLFKFKSVPLMPSADTATTEWTTMSATPSTA